MSTNKKYYFLKFKEDFFRDETIILLEDCKDGFLFSNILLKMYLLSLKHEGQLLLQQGIAYTPQMIATLTNHQVGTVEKALQIFMQLGLVEELTDGTLFMSNIEQFEQMKADNIGLLLWGNVGTGKSYFAGCIANALIDKEISVCMTNFAVILSSMMNLQTDKNEYIQSLNRNSLLIIDDFGMERDTPFALEQIYNVIDSRYTACKPLIVTTNLTLSEMQNTALQTDYRRIYDRVLEMCVPILFEGESKRKDKAEEKRNKLKEILK